MKKANKILAIATTGRKAHLSETLGHVAMHLEQAKKLKG